MGVRDRRAGVFLGAVMLLPGCRTLPYQPYEVAVPGALPTDAFERVRDHLLRHWGALVQSDTAGFRLQTGWVPHQRGDAPGRRRASVFRLDPERLGVVVEVSWLVHGLLGDFTWTAARGDAGLEAELGEALRQVLAGGG